MIAVGNGLAALAAARRGPVPELIASDLMMPGMDEFELLQAVRADAATRDVVVIVLSARAAEEARLEGLNAGADGYMVKPFSAREFAARVDGALALARQRRAAAAREQALLDEECAGRSRFCIRNVDAKSGCCSSSASLAPMLAYWDDVTGTARPRLP